MAKQGNPKTDFEWKIVEKVLKQRNLQKISQAKLADFLEVSRGYIGQIEMRSSGSMYTYDQLNKLADFLKCSPKDFMPSSSFENNKEVFYDSPPKLHIDDIREELSHIRSQAAAWTLLLDINESILENWDTQAEKNNLKKLKEISKALGSGNKNILFPQDSEKTSLSNALQLEYNRLLKKGLTQKVTKKDHKGNIIKVNNPEFVQALRDFVEEYKKKGE